MRRRRDRRDPEPPPTGKLDFPPPGAEFDGAIVLSGWAAFPTEPTARVEARIGEVPLGRARLGLARPDVAAVSAAVDAAVSGFELRASRADHPDIPLGDATLRVVATSLGGERQEFEPVPIRVAAEPPAPEVPGPSRRAGPQPASGRGLRLLVFTNVLRHGGASLYLFDLLREAHAQGRIEPCVVSAADGDLRGELEGLGIEVHIASPSSLDALGPYLDRVEELAAWATPGGFEAVLVNTTSGHTAIGGEVAARLGLPAVWTIHESFELAELWAGLGDEVRARSEATLSGAATAVFEAESTRRMYLRTLDPGRTVVIPYGVDFGPVDRARAGFDPAAARRAAAIPVDADLVLAVGTIEPRKAQVPLALAFEAVAERFPRARLALVGVDSRPDSRALVERVEASPLRERIHLVPVSGEVQRWYGMADVFVSASDIESLPRSVLEAMAWEKPVLATAVFGLPELIDDGETGWLCEARDVERLEAGLERALEAPAEERLRIGAAGRELVVRRHALGAYAAAVADLLDRVVGRSATGDGLSTMPPR